MPESIESFYIKYNEEEDYYILLITLESKHTIFNVLDNFWFEVEGKSFQIDFKLPRSGKYKLGIWQSFISRNKNQVQILYKHTTIDKDRKLQDIIKYKK